MTDQRKQDDATAPGALGDGRKVGRRQGAGDRHGEGVGAVLVAHLVGRQVETSERPELMAAARLDGTDESDALFGVERVASTVR